MQSIIVTKPTGMLMSLGEAKTHLRVDHTLDDGYIQSLIMAATSQVEAITRRKLITQTWLSYYDDWPNSNHFEIPFGQLQSVTHVKYLDSDLVEHTWVNTDYIVDTNSEPGLVVKGYNKTYPSDTLSTSNPIYIQYVCGYGDHTLKTITGATNASPIVITAIGHGCATGDSVLIANVGGNTNANGMWPILWLSADTFSLVGSAGNAAYTSGGTACKVEVPEQIRTAMLLMIGNWYAYRESIQAINVKEIPQYLMALLWPYRLWTREI